MKHKVKKKILKNWRLKLREQLEKEKRYYKETKRKNYTKG